MSDYKIRLIKPDDNKPLADVIRTVLTQQGNNVDGTVFTDEATDRMFDGYQTENSVYYIVEIDNKVVGGCGVAQLIGEKETTCELQRLFLLKEARGYGIGQKLVEKCINFAKRKGYKLMYLETFPNMVEAIGLYKKNGFKLIDKPLGSTGHFYCTTRMTLDL
ncbi:MAG TPA: GNAT family N-acetyltransferase [Crocinitomix sp.]|nr:GNAT family N-acetyltransferase [Crocinitomix sp.]